MFRLARITVKQHRFELASALILAALLGAVALWTEWQLVGLDVLPGCFGIHSLATAPLPADCADKLNSFADIYYSTHYSLEPALLILPFFLGIVLGVPLVARELEARTAQTAWSVSPSRRAWLAHQVLPVLVVAGAALAFVATAAALLHITTSQYSNSVFNELGTYGSLLVARGLLALGLGIVVGIILGRVLAGVLVGFALCVVFAFVVAGGARDVWVHAQPYEVIPKATLEAGGVALIFDEGYVSPEGAFLTDDEALNLVPSDVLAREGWLSDHGYERAYAGLSAATTAAWEPIETIGTTVLGLAVLGCAFLLVSRRRPE